MNTQHKQYYYNQKSLNKIDEMPFDKVREGTFWSTMRASPIIFNCFNGLRFLIEPNEHTFYFMSAYILTFYSNDLLKKTFKSLYLNLGTNYIPGLGQGTRPLNSTNCGYFLKLDNPPSISFGMPSGHSQKVWFITTYFLLKLWENDNYNRNLKICNTILFGLIPYYVMYSRLRIEKCHTYGQLIIGEIIGCIMGFGTYYYEDYIIDTTKDYILSHLDLTYFNLTYFG